MPVEKLKKFLDENRIKYVTISHSIAYTSQEVAASSHVSGKDLAKAVVIKVDGVMAMAVLPASYQVDFDRLRDVLGAGVVELADEEEFRNSFPGCELGAMPPFGNLYGMEVYVDERLRENEEIAFNAGTHTELIKLSYGDFERLVGPKVFAFSCGFA